jgi:transcriptional regulator with XRE-family HTH domain
MRTRSGRADKEQPPAAEQPRAPEGLIASRLEHLFRTVHPKDRGPHTAAEVADAINGAAGEHVIGATYVWQLKTGRRDNPTYKHLLAISRFFGVSPMYFFDEAETRRGAIPAEVTAALTDDEVREIALRAAGLSEHSLKAIRAMIESARAMERTAPGRSAS